MNCFDARRMLGAAPSARSPELVAHLATCSGCAGYAAEMTRLDAALRRALEITVPEPRGISMTASRATVRTRARWYALAASVVGVAILSALLWSVYPREALATALVGHMAGEPQAWRVVDAAVDSDALAAVLRRAGVELAADAPLVSYASSCWFRGAYVPHLVVQTPDGPMTVMVLAHERVTQPTWTDEDGYRVVIVPAQRGAIAILTQGAIESSKIAAIVARVVAAVRYRG